MAAITTTTVARSARQSWLGKYRLKSPLAIIALCVFVLLVAGALLAPLIAPADPLKGNLRFRAVPPGAQFWLGTDAQGRDILSRILFGTLMTLKISVMSMFFGGMLGAVLGLLGAYYRRLDMFIMRLNDVLLSFPAVLVGLALAGVLGAGVVALTISLSIAAFPAAARIARSAAMTVVQREYLESGRAAGLSDLRLLTRYILRNAAPEIIVFLTFQFGQTILLAVSLSFLGLGVNPPAPELGSMIGDGRALLFTAPHVALVPCVTIFLLVMSVNLMGDALRDMLDPQLSR
jgi:ABC-type dipeptide/oligopeptide/nickel transport system permease subunit